MSARAIDINYCTQCGGLVDFVVPRGDNMHRHVCRDAECGFIHYQNPKIVAGCIVRWHDQILLCKRAIEPRRGLWTFPAGFLENGEGADVGAARETAEEACADVRHPALFGVYNLPNANQVYMVFCGTLTEPRFAPGVESLETKLFSQGEVPWDSLAFKVVERALRHYFEQWNKDDIRPFMDSLP